MNDLKEPTVLIPYPGPCDKPQCQDFFFYLRPETNGVKTESTLLRIVQQPVYRERIEFIYLANIPGSFIVQNHIVEEHYSVKLHYAKRGKLSFTPHMVTAFENYFHVCFHDAQLMGSFEALQRLRMTEEELFNHWVPAQDLLIIDGQTIKKISNIFVLNYDIPALLHKNNNSTDIAVMIFRSTLPVTLFLDLVREMERALVREEILNPQVPFSRAFHYSKSPFEQILDAVGYSYISGSSHVRLEDISFCSYLLDKGMTLSEIVGSLKHPIMQFRSDEGTVVENDLLSYTFESSYFDAYRKLRTCVSNWLLVDGGD